VLLTARDLSAQLQCSRNVEITNASVELTPGDPSKATALVTVVNRGEQSDQFQSALSTVAPHVELADGSGADVALPPNSTRQLRLVLSGVNQKLSIGSQFPLVLIFQIACMARVDVRVIQTPVPERTRAAQSPLYWCALVGDVLGEAGGRAHPPRNSRDRLGRA